MRVCTNWFSLLNLPLGLCLKTKLNSFISKCTGVFEPFRVCDVWFWEGTGLGCVCFCGSLLASELTTQSPYGVYVFHTQTEILLNIFINI